MPAGRNVSFALHCASSSAWLSALLNARAAHSSLEALGPQHNDWHVCGRVLLAKPAARVPRRAITRADSPLS